MTEANEDDDSERSDEELANALYAAYESGYDDPRRLHYAKIAEKWGSENIGETDALADAFDLGCRHADKDVEKFEKIELLEEMASW